MLTMYTGTPGSGKSLKCAYELIEWINAGTSVICNFPIDKSYFKKRKRGYGEFDYVPNEELTVEFLKAYCRLFHKPFKESQTLLVIDEAGCIFNCRAWNDRERVKWLDFFAKHRKLGFEIIIVSQVDKQIDKKILGCVEYEYKFKSVKNFGNFGWLLSNIFGHLFLCHVMWYSSKTKLTQSFFRRNKRTADIYYTFEFFD